MSKKTARASRKKAKQKTAKTATRKTTASAAGVRAARALADPGLVERRKRARSVLRRLRKLYPVADCALLHRNAFELLVATILSAQSTDVTVNKVTPVLFARYPGVRKLAAAGAAAVEKIIHTTGFFRQKARNIIGCARLIVERHDGEVPDSIEDLTALPGVARKTANVVLGTWFGKNEGVVVDTHVGRLADRLALAWNHNDTKDAVQIEKDLQAVLPRKHWTYFSHALIWHGRKVCSARKPRCEECTLVPDCPAAFGYGP